MGHANELVLISDGSTMGGEACRGCTLATVWLGSHFIPREQTQGARELHKLPLMAGDITCMVRADHAYVRYIYSPKSCAHYLTVSTDYEA